MSIQVRDESVEVVGYFWRNNNMICSLYWGCKHVYAGFGCIKCGLDLEEV